MDRKLYIDEGEKKLTFVNVQDVEPILDFNKVQRAEEATSDWGRRIARIPNAILLQWFYEEHARGNVALQMYSDEFDRLVARKLADPDWAYLRTDKPKLQMGFG